MYFDESPLRNLCLGVPFLNFKLTLVIKYTFFQEYLVSQYFLNGQISEYTIRILHVRRALKHPAHNRIDVDNIYAGYLCTVKHITRYLELTLL